MPTLMKIESELRETEAEILSCYDIETGEELTDPSELEDRITILHQQAIVKRDHYTKILKGDFFKRMEGILDKKISDLKKEKEDLQFRKEQIELALHNHVIKNYEEVMPILNEEGKPELYITPTLSVRKEIVDLDQVEGSYLKAKLPVVPYFDFESVYSAVLRSKDPRAIEAVQRMKDGLNKSCNVTDLPENHPAIKRTIKPTVKITKGKPKDANTQEKVPD